jgi:ketosteroid isomerase-like protein
MSRESVEIVARQFEDTNTRNFEGVLAGWADDVVLTLHGDGPVLAGQDVVGKTAVGEWFGEWFRAFDRDYRFEIEELQDWGERVFVVATHHVRGRASGVPLTQQAAWVYTVGNGRIVKIDAFGTREQALEAGGRPE